MDQEEKAAKVVVKTMSYIVGELKEYEASESVRTSEVILKLVELAMEEYARSKFK